MTALTITITSVETTPATFVADASEGKVLFHTERADGTYRRVHFLAEGTDERAAAEWVDEQREAGRTMRAIAGELHVSIPTVRRMINDLLLTREIEESDEEELAELLAGAEEQVEA